VKMGGITLRQKDEQHQSVAKGLVGWLWGRRVGDSGGIDWVGISTRVLIIIRRLNFRVCTNAVGTQ
jgi:hypothetical protein